MIKPMNIRMIPDISISLRYFFILFFVVFIDINSFCIWF